MCSSPGDMEESVDALTTSEALLSIPPELSVLVEFSLRFALSSVEAVASASQGNAVVASSKLP